MANKLELRIVRNDGLRMNPTTGRTSLTGLALELRPDGAKIWHRFQAQDATAMTLASANMGTTVLATAYASNRKRTLRNGSIRDSVTTMIAGFTYMSKIRTHLAA